MLGVKLHDFTPLEISFLTGLHRDLGWSEAPHPAAAGCVGKLSSRMIALEDTIESTLFIEQHPCSSPDRGHGHFQVLGNVPVRHFTIELFDNLPTQGNFFKLGGRQDVF